MTITYQAVRLPEDRIAQLRAHAAHEGVSMGGAIGRLFDVLYRDTGVVHHIPSVSVHALADGLVIQLPDSNATGFGFDDARHVVETIRAYLSGEHAGEKVVRVFEGGTFAIWRKGNGFKVSIPANAPEKNFTPDLLNDLANIIESEITKAQA